MRTIDLAPFSVQPAPDTPAPDLPASGRAASGVASGQAASTGRPVREPASPDRSSGIPLPACGVEPGLRFALLLDGRGGARPMGWSEIAAWRPEHGVLWIHLERDHPETQAWVRTSSGINPVIAEAVIAEESRPRIETLDDTLMIVLRGLSRVADPDEPVGHEVSGSAGSGSSGKLAAGPGAAGAGKAASGAASGMNGLGGGLDFVPVHLLVEPRRVISLRDQRHQMHALRDVRGALARGRGPTGPAGILVAIADKIIKDLEPYLDRLDDDVDRLEVLVLGGDAHNVRSGLAVQRRRAIHLRRYLAPQRDAMNRPQHEDTSWLDGRARVQLREVFDKVLRYLEYLDSIRDRATILHEDLSSLIAERIARTSNRLAAVASLLLPPTLLAGLLGMNVGGIPGAGEPRAFLVVTVCVAVATGGILGILRLRRWL